MKRLKEIFDVRDLHAYGGIVLIAAGLTFIYWPAAFIVVGLILLWLALRRVDHA